MIINKFMKIFTPFSYTYFSTVLATILNLQPFSDLFRGFLYSLIPLYGLITVIVNRKQKFIKETITYIALAFNLFICLMVIIHGDLLVYGFCILGNLFLCWTSLYEKTNRDIESNIYSLVKFIIIYTFVFSIISLLLNPIFDNTNLLELLHSKNIKFFDEKLSYNNYRLYGLGGHPNTTGIICCIGMMASIYYAMIGINRYLHIVAYLNIGLCLICIILASSRTSMLAIAFYCVSFFILLFFGLKYNNKEYKKRVIVLIVIAIVYILINLLILICLFDNPLELFLDKIIRVDNIKGATGRDKIQDKVLQMVQGHLILGIQDSSIIKTIGYTAHNSYLQVLASSGILGLMLYVIFWVYALNCNLRIIINRNKISSNIYLLSIFFTSVIIGALVHACFETSLYLDLTLPEFFIFYCAYLSGNLWYNVKKEIAVK